MDHCVTCFDHMRFVYAALLIAFLSVGCSKTSKEPKEDELMFTPIEDSGFFHDVEQDDGERDSFETVHAKLATQRTLKFSKQSVLKKLHKDFQN